MKNWKKYHVLPSRALKDSPRNRIRAALCILAFNLTEQLEDIPNGKAYKHLMNVYNPLFKEYGLPEFEAFLFDNDGIPDNIFKNLKAFIVEQYFSRPHSTRSKKNWDKIHSVLDYHRWVFEAYKEKKFIAQMLDMAEPQIRKSLINLIK